MHDHLLHKPARFGGLVLAVFALIGLVAPSAFGADKLELDRIGVDVSDRKAEIAEHKDAIAEEHARFFENMPPEMLKAYAPDAATQEASKFGADTFDRLEATIRPRPIPELAQPIITSVEFNEGVPTVEFQVVDEFGFGIEGFVQEQNVEFEFTVNKLVPREGGKTPNWQAYVLAADEGVPDAQPGAYTEGTLEELGDGNYRFTFAGSVESISGVVFEPELTHRVGMEVRDPEVRGEEVEGTDTAFDIQPSTGATTGIESREIVTQEACAACHGTEDFAFHGGPRQDVRQCVSCHQPGALDVGSGNTIDFTVMIHKIHTGENLNNKPLEFCGFGCENFGRPPDDFSEVTYPQSTMNCVACHDPGNPATPQAIQIANNPTAENCASCHDDLQFDENGLTNERRNHIGLAQPNSTCAACHSEDGLMISSLESHLMEDAVVAQQFQYNILQVTNSGEGQSPVIRFSVTDPTNDDAPYDIANDPPFTGPGTRLAMGISWPNTDFNNVGNNDGTTTTGRAVGQGANISIAGQGTGLPDYVMANGDGTFTLDTALLPNPITVPSTNPPLGSGTVILEGHLAADFNRDDVYDDELPVTSASSAFAINDATANPRRVVADLVKCQACHGVNDGLSLHGNNRTDNIEVCASCHTADATDLFRRPVDPDGMANGVNEAAADGIEDRTVDMKYMIHAIHAADMREEPYYVYGFGGSEFDFSEVTYPRSPADCDACHTGDTFSIPLEGVLATTVNSNATVVGNSFFGANAFMPDDGSATDPTDDNNFSPESAVCVACHDDDVAKQHMAVRSDSPISFGNGYLLNPDPFGDPDTQDRIDMNPENCGFCHRPGGFVDVAEVHGLLD